jgi:hypothetical protein
MLMIYLMYDRSMVLFESSIRTDALWRRAFFTYWNDDDANSFICCGDNTNSSTSTSTISSSKSSTTSSTSISTSSTRGVYEKKGGSVNEVIHWREKFQRRARVDRNWLIGRYHRHRLPLTDVSFVCLDSLHHRMITIQSDSVMTLWSRRPSAAASQRAPSVVSNAPSGDSKTSTSSSGATAAAADRSSTVLPPNHQIQSESLSSNNPTIHNKGTSNNGEWSFERTIGRCIGIPPLSCCMDWKHEYMAVIDWYERRSYEVTIISLETGLRVHTLSLMQYYFPISVLPPSPLPILTWLFDGRLMVTAPSRLYAAIWTPIWRRHISHGNGNGNSISYERMMNPRIGMELHSGASRFNDLRTPSAIAIDHDPIVTGQTCVLGLSSGNIHLLFPINRPIIC